ncbi:AsnC family transcriptional regulator [Streptomyces glebosus]|uniref:AsnC family transcriptional regulator n=1 Tax=Streptomyces glebosus TaxID=249580 RepID=A0A640SXW2_9ACTN|nr:Lrp/AsnC family transcriptional regulator [Streptomyces glebosus]GFE16257.1 AsnC family transcriptional regulator [Streptomyces glebosus]GHG63847.1 AsnC family transcriptional regulator [Streptomyces glebosus]
MNAVTLDGIDRDLVHALQIDGRAPFRTIAEVLGISENTVARRYRRLRAHGVLRVAGVFNGVPLGHTSWTLRLQCLPDAADAVATALAGRSDTSFVYVLCGGAEISCNVRTPSADERDALFLRKLPRTGRITSVSAHLLLRATALPHTWAGAARLSAEQVRRLQPPASASFPLPLPLSSAPSSLSAEPSAPDAQDRAMLDLLARDGRTGYRALAVAARVTDSTAKRRLDALRRAGVLTYAVDIAPAALGFPTEARLWMSVRPAALAGVATAMAQHPEVSFAAMTTGPSNLVAAVNCRNPDDLCRYLTERVAALDGVRSMESAPVIRTLKRCGATLPVGR